MKLMMGLLAALASIQTLAVPKEDDSAETTASYAESQKLATPDLWNAIKELKVARNAWKMQDERMAGYDHFTPKLVGMEMVLLARKTGHEPQASFYWSLEQMDRCKFYTQMSVETKACWKDAVDALKIASDAGIADASFNIALLYENGFGEISSKLAASGWYVKAANQYMAMGDKDKALEAVEHALNDVPDHPAALLLKGELLK